MSHMTASLTKTQSYLSLSDVFGVTGANNPFNDLGDVNASRDGPAEALSSHSRRHYDALANSNSNGNGNGYLNGNGADHSDSALQASFTREQILYTFLEEDITVMRALSKIYPDIDTVASEIAIREATLVSSPPGNVHVISDIHGEAQKLQHVLSNASGTLRPLVEKLFERSLDENHIRRVLYLIFNPTGFFDHYEDRLKYEDFFLENQLVRILHVIRHFSKQYSIDHVRGLMKRQFQSLLMELIYSPRIAADKTHVTSKNDYIYGVAETMRKSNRIYRFLRVLSQLVRNLATEELLVGGDLWDRGPRGDKVVDILMEQPNVWITWGNHDAAWFGACVGSEACIAYVLRVSARYNVLRQLEEGYGISLVPLEMLAKKIYGDDPATRYTPKNTKSHRDEILLAQMHKAAAVMQYKLEGQLIKRHPEFQLDQDLVLHTFDLAAATCELDGKEYAILDTNFPTLDPNDPYELSVDEKECIKAMKNNFFHSSRLWEHMKFLINRGSSYAIRHNHLIFHGAVPVDEKGEFLDFPINGIPYKGRALFDAFSKEAIATLREPTPYRQDLMWYMWCGPRSPFMAKERIATLERDLIPDHDAWVEKKNPYFKLIHEVWFCDKILEEFGCDSDGLIINGHVPVSVKADENPVKRSGKAVAIDGAFSEAYGDYGYTLVIDLEERKTLLAQHHHTEDAFDVVPQIKCIKNFKNVSKMFEMGVRNEIQMLEKLLIMYESNRIPQQLPAGRI